MKVNHNHATPNRVNPVKNMPVLFVGHGSPMNAIEANELFKQLMVEKQHADLANYRALGPTVQEADDDLSFFNDQALAGSLTMTSVLIESAD